MNPLRKKRRRNTYISDEMGIEPKVTEGALQLVIGRLWNRFGVHLQCLYMNVNERVGQTLGVAFTYLTEVIEVFFLVSFLKSLPSQVRCHVRHVRVVDETIFLTLGGIVTCGTGRSACTMFSRTTLE